MKPVLLLALARPTFDVPFAESCAGEAFRALDTAGIATTGPRALLFDADAVRAVLNATPAAAISAVLVLQVTFTDAAMTVDIARTYAGLPLALWSLPEPRAGGRLRLNAFCGLNLAAHALGRAGLPHRWFHGAPEDAGLAPFLAALGQGSTAPPLHLRPAVAGSAAAQAAAALDAALESRRIGLVGEHPAGFDTCRYEPETLAKLSGITVEPITLGETFARARAVPAAETEKRRAAASTQYKGLADVDAAQLGRSLALHAALETMRDEKKLDAYAVRCWPETFTDYGCAVCGPMGMMSEAGTPCACEADVHGALTALLMQEAAGAPSWLVDIVDMDAESDTGVLWHCGSAPLSMGDPDFPAEAQIHTNRKMPLLAQFTLKPGRITLARLSQARNGLFLVLGSGTVQRAPMAFTGTSAVIALDGGIGPARDRLIGEALEHHVAIAYGDHRAVLEAWAARKGLPVMDLTP